MTATPQLLAHSFACISLCLCSSACSPPQESAQPKTQADATPKPPEPVAAPVLLLPAGCEPGAWCSVSGLPAQTTFNAVWGSKPEDVWIAGDLGTLLHFDGKAWSAVPSGTESSLRALAGTSAKDLWAGGLDGTLLHYDGSKWSSAQANGTPWSPVPPPNARPVYGLCAARPNQVWVAGSGVRYFDGNAWLAPFHPSHLSITALWAADATHTWAIGKAGTLWIGEGDQWTTVPHLIGPDYFGIWGSSANDVWIVGSGGNILHWDGKAVLPSSSGTTVDLHAVYGTNAHDVWAVGDQGTLLHWENANWKASPGATTNALLAIWAANERDIWIVGENGIVLRRRI